MTFNTTNVTLDELHLSDVNVRTHKEDATEVSALAASIASVGLIQPLVVVKRPGKGKGYEVVAGGRRLRALQQLVEAGQRLEAEMLEVIVLESRDKLTEISLAENYARKMMRPFEVYQAFARIRAERPKATFEELGAMFGFDTTRTARIMRLANLSEKVMAAYAQGEIDDAMAQAYASTEDQALQDRVYDDLSQLPEYQRRSSDIRRAMGQIGRDEKQLLEIVGFEAYREAGGRFEQDLFQEEGEGRLLDPQILEGLYQQTVEALKDGFIHSISRNGRKIVADGSWGMADLKFAWAEKPPQITQYGYTSDDHELLIRNPKREPFTEDQKLRMDQINARLAELEAKEELSDEEAAEEGRLEDEREALDTSRAIILPKKGAIVGVVDISYSGGLSVKLWYASRAEKGLADPAGAKTRGAKGAEKSPAERERARWGLSKDNMQVMRMVRRDMVREMLHRDASMDGTIALEFLLYSQAWAIVHAKKGYGGSSFCKGGPVGVYQLPSDDGAPGKLRNAAAALAVAPEAREFAASLKEAAPFAAADPVEGYYAFRQAPDRFKKQVAALVANHTLLASTSYYSDGETPRMLEALANEIDAGSLEWRETVTMDAKFFDMMSHKARRSLLEEWGAADHPDGLKGKTSAAFCARVVGADDEEWAKLGINDEDSNHNAAWLPDFLETGAVPPLEQKAATGLTRRMEAAQDDEDEVQLDDEDELETEPAE